MKAGSLIFGIGGPDIAMAAPLCAYTAFTGLVGNVEVAA